MFELELILGHAHTGASEFGVAPILHEDLVRLVWLIRLSHRRHAACIARLEHQRPGEAGSSDRYTRAGPSPSNCDVAR